MTKSISLGDPNIGNLFSNENLECVISGLSKQELGFIISAPDMGKGYLCLSIAYEVASGEHIVGVSTLTGLRQKVLYWPIEDKPARVVSRHLKHLNDMPGSIQKDVQDNVSIYPSTDPLFSTSKIANDKAIQALIDEAKGCDLLIIDTLREAFGSLHEVDDDILAKSTLQRIAREADCAVLAVHHVTKNVARGEEPISNISGNGFSQTLANSRLQIALHHSNNKKTQGTVISHVKANNISQDMKLNSIPICWTEDGLLHTSVFQTGNPSTHAKQFIVESKEAELYSPGRNKTQKSTKRQAVVELDEEDEEPKVISLDGVVDDSAGETGNSFFSQEDRELHRIRTNKGNDH